MFSSAFITQKVAPKTMNNHLAVLRRILALAVEWGKLKSLPVIRWLRVPEQGFSFLSFEAHPSPDVRRDAVRLLNGPPAPRLAPAVRTHRAR
jgi:hypothetical protein